MITIHSKEYKALTTSQKAKVRKALAAYYAERDPLSMTVYQYENELRVQAYKELNCAERVKAMRAELDPQIKAIEAQVAELRSKERELMQARYDREIEITGEPYTVVYNDPKSKALREVSQSITKRHEAKMDELLASFQNAEVA